LVIFCGFYYFQTAAAPALKGYHCLEKIMEKKPSEPPRTAIIIGCDHAAYPLKELIKSFLVNAGYRVEDVGTFSQSSVDYPEFAIRVASHISEGLCERGILLCGTGIGMSMVANRFRNVRAALCSDPFSARLSRQHNDANILVLGGRILGETMALETVDAWLNTGFDGGRHQKRLEMFNQSGQESSRNTQQRNVS
jgi:ribose 5-phosphate isomerase B